MRSSLRVVFDTNVLVSAFLFPDSVPGQVLFRPRLAVIPLMSADLLGELGSVLSRAKLDKYVKPKRRLDLLAAYVSRCDRIDISISIRACRDPRDDHLLELAVSGGAHAIVTGDGDLLCLDPFQGIRIVSPADFDSI